MDDVFSAHRHEAGTTLRPASAALVIVDMINEFCKPGGKMVLPGYETLIPRQQELITAAKAAGMPVIFVIDSHRKGMRRDREFLKRTAHGEENSWATQVVDEIAPGPDDIVVIKHRYSAFFQTDLDLVLKDMLIDQILVCGVVTNICVRSTVHDGFFLGYDVVVPFDACAATGPREQDSSLYDIATHFGTVAPTSEVTTAIAEKGELINRVFES
ncbi:cysteine hydrolase family protein [Hoeflea ulvae]|uniref:Cysteine hydrolase n=1 Tax=Hoeflea ulvae TaxID=2983764 RepID=A0ABT3YM26_9HYPH|nr:isochorismatase family cysteine hydrolase [Hoeflea ulvae]MCY0096986.1 cysteine hydrolase [Hoeflea ulvae]